MDTKQIPVVPAESPAAVQGYERPQIEVVMTADDLSREILYAGVITGGKGVSGGGQ